jgi:hypothetical protein
MFTYTIYDLYIAEVFGFLVGLLVTSVYFHFHNKRKRDSRGRFVK